VATRESTGATRTEASCIFGIKKLTRISYYDGHEHRLERFTKIR